MRLFRFSPEAARDIRKIWRYIARDNERAADRIYDQFYRAADMLGRNPRLGHNRPELTGKRLLFWTVGEYVLIYRLEPRPLQIARILHGARDLNPSSTKTLYSTQQRVYHKRDGDRRQTRPEIRE